MSDTAIPGAPASKLGDIIAKARKWQTSLTLQGVALAGLATFIATKGPPLLIAVGVPPSVAQEGVTDVSLLLGAVGTVLGFVGRLRIGDLK